MGVRDTSGVNVDFTQTRIWLNWERRQLTNVFYYHPKDIRGLVAVVVEAERRGMRIHASGSRWSFGDVAKPDKLWLDLHEMTDLENVEGQEDSQQVIWSNTQDIITDEAQQMSEGGLFVVLGGARLWEVNEALWNLGYSLLTLGGSQGQTLAGALSTGTHGTDIEISSLADSVRAIHLVGPGGQEYWIERQQGVTDPDRLANYFVWDESIKQFRTDDDVFESTLVSLGRFGVIYSVLLEVASRYHLYERRVHASWDQPVSGERLTFKQRLANVRSSRTTQSLNDGDQGLRAIKIDLNPLGWGHGTYGRLTRRWVYDQDHHSGDSVAPLSSPVHMTNFFTTLVNIVHAHEILNLILEEPTLIVLDPVKYDIYAEINREVFTSESPPHNLVDRNYFITSGKATSEGYASDYEAMWNSGPFVVSMEFFLDCINDDVVAFVEDVYRCWGGFSAGYIAIRFGARSPAKLGPQRYELTVAVEVTIFQDMPDGQAVHDTVLQLARDKGVVPHWGQDSLLTAPEVQAHYGDDARAWRRALYRLSQEGNLQTFSNSFSRRLGLEYGPGVMISRDGHLRSWLGWNEEDTSTFHSGDFVGPATSPGALHIAKRPSKGLVIQPNGYIQAKWRPLASANADGNLVLKRNGKTMAVIEAAGNLGNIYYSQHEWLPDWLLK